MRVDVQAEAVIARPRAVVSAYAADPHNAPKWYANIRSMELRTHRPLGVGSMMEFVAVFLGRRIAYTYEVVEYVAGDRLVMRTADGPFPMETTYTWTDDAGGTRMTLRNRGEPTGFAKVTAPVLERAMRHAMRKDLARLKALLESGTDG